MCISSLRRLIPIVQAHQVKQWDSKNAVLRRGGDSCMEISWAFTHKILSSNSCYCELSMGELLAQKQASLWGASLCSMISHYWWINNCQAQPPHHYGEEVKNKVKWASLWVQDQKSLFNYDEVWLRCSWVSLKMTNLLCWAYDCPSWKQTYGAIDLRRKWSYLSSISTWGWSHDVINKS